MSKSNPPSAPFTFFYGTSERLPYAYTTFPLSSVVSVVSQYAGVSKVTLSAADWLRTQVYDTCGMIEAENYTSMSGVQKNEISTEGGQNVGYIENGDYLVFNNVNFGSNGASSFQARVACSTAGGSIEIRLDSPTGTLIGTVPVTGTGGWQTWVTKTGTLSGATGTHQVYLKFTGSSGYLFNLNWFKFI